MHKMRRQAWQVILGYHTKSVLNGHSTQHASPQAKIQGRGRVDKVDELTISNSADCSLQVAATAKKSSITACDLHQPDGCMMQILEFLASKCLH
jgi:hypothetical protein